MVATQFGSLRFDTLYQMDLYGLILPEVWSVDESGDFCLTQVAAMNCTAQSKPLCAVQHDNNIFAVSPETQVFSLKYGWIPISKVEHEDLLCFEISKDGKTRNEYKTFHVVSNDVEMTTFTMDLKNGKNTVVLQNGLVARKT